MFDTLVSPSLNPVALHGALLYDQGVLSEEELSIQEVLMCDLLHAVFQPILDFRARGFLGYEGLIRGPAGSLLHTPSQLFTAADECGLRRELEACCRKAVIRDFAALGLPGRLFMNVSPSCLLEELTEPDSLLGKGLRLAGATGMAASRIVVELTENQSVADLPGIQKVLARMRESGSLFAIDDLGEGFANLRMWSDLRPEYVKIDRHFVHGIADDSLKFHFVRAMQDLAESCNARLIAEGIERESDLRTLRDMGVACGQGFLICHPQREPADRPSPTVLRLIDRGTVAVFPGGGSSGRVQTARSILREVVPVTPETPTRDVLKRFEEDCTLDVLPVVDRGQPVGLINRNAVSELFARPFSRELYARRACTQLMDATPLVVDHRDAIQSVGMLLARLDGRYLRDGFIIVDDSGYAGVGSGQNLMGLITEMQISAARYANPLTQLPGNVPINEHIDRLLAAAQPFAVCYFDIDHFKPFNDAFGYRAGDDVILMLGQLLEADVSQREDFVGHVGGDDFIAIFQSADWEPRCRRILAAFDERVARHGGPEVVNAGGYLAENRRGESVRYPLPSLSIGAIWVMPGFYDSHRDVSAAAGIAKKEAKKVAGSSLFIERRQPLCRQVEPVLRLA